MRKLLFLLLTAALALPMTAHDGTTHCSEKGFVSGKP